jgi:hypothetical protein
VAVGRVSGQITRSLILRTALGIIDSDGVDVLSMRRLSDAVDRDTTVPYRHVTSKAAVLDGAAEIVLSQLSVYTTDRDWVGRLRIVAHQFRAMALKHPNVVPLLVTRPLATPLARRPRALCDPSKTSLRCSRAPGSPATMPSTSTGCCSPTCTAMSSTNCRRSSNDPRKPIMSYSLGCIGCRSPSSPNYVPWHRRWPHMTGAPNSTVASTSCSPDSSQPLPSPTDHPAPPETTRTVMRQ